MIALSSPDVGEDELLEISKVFDSCWLGMGNVVYEFENKIKDYLGTNNFISTNTGTTALHLALEVLGIGKGDEVILPSFTFAATVQAVLHAQATPVFCDVDIDTLNISINSALSCLSKKTKAIIPVHYRGLSCDMDNLIKIGRDYQLKIIEDAAHAFGSLYKGRKLGSFGDITCFSFDPIKLLTTGEGGGISFQEKEILQKAEVKRILGIDKDTVHRYKNERAWDYDVVDKGYRYHMSNINAAIGMAQLKKVSNFIKVRQEICRFYDECFADKYWKNKILGLYSNYEDMAPFIYVVKVLDRNRDQLINFLKSQKITAGVHYMPSHHKSFFKNFRCTDLSATDLISNQIITLPLHSRITKNDVLFIVEKIACFFEGKYD